MDAQTKICPNCKEQIKIDAKKCPHCHSWLNRGFGLLSNPGIISFISVILTLAFFFFLFRDIWGPKKDFSNFANGIEILNPVINVSTDSKCGLVVSTIGKIKNNTNIKWEDLRFELQYFNKNGQLVDTYADKDYDLILIPHTEQTFRIRSTADKPASEYSNVKVFIRFAKEAHIWP